MSRPLAKVACAAAALIVIVYAYLTLRSSVPALSEKRLWIRKLELQNAELARQIEAKRERIRRLRESESEQELEIRQRLKLVRPGEKVFILQDPERK